MLHTSFAICRATEPSLAKQLRVAPRRPDPFKSSQRSRLLVPSRFSKRDLLLGGLTPCFCARCQQPLSTPSWYQRYFAHAMFSTMDLYESLIQPIKQDIFNEVLGPGTGVQKVLEIGVGTGPNFKFYPPGLSVTGLDPNPAMSSYAEGNAASAGMPAGAFEFVEGDAAALPFADASFDAAVVTLVLCSVPDVPAVLSELRRVLRPGGRVAVVEHVGAPGGTWVALAQHLLDPLQRALADSCSLTRDTGASLAAAPFAATALRRVELQGAGLLAPHVVGSVTV